MFRDIDHAIRYCLGRYLLSLDWGTERWVAWGTEEFPHSNVH